MALSLVELLMLWRKHIIETLGRDVERWEVIQGTVEEEVRRRLVEAEAVVDRLKLQLKQLGTMHQLRA